MSYIIIIIITLFTEGGPNELYSSLGPPSVNKVIIIIIIIISRCIATTGITSETER